MELKRHKDFINENKDDFPEGYYSAIKTLEDKIKNAKSDHTRKRFLGYYFDIVMPQHQKEEYKEMLKSLTNESINNNSSNPTVEPGDRIEMIQMADDPAPIEAGTKGTVITIDGIGQIHVNWDNGRSLAIIPEEDRFKIIED